MSSDCGGAADVLEYVIITGISFTGKDESESLFRVLPLAYFCEAAQTQANYFGKCLSAKLKNPTVTCVVWLCQRNTNLTSPLLGYRLPTGTEKKFPMSLQFPAQGMNQQGRHVGNGAGVIPSGCCDLNTLLLLFGGWESRSRTFFFPFLKSLLQSLPIMPNLCSHFQILPDAVETFLAWWRQDKDKGEGNCSVWLSAEERELFGFEPGQNDWFFTSDDDWRIGTVLRDMLGVSGAVVVYLNDEFKAAVLWNGLLCKLGLNSALYFNNDLWNSHSEILPCVVK